MRLVDVTSPDESGARAEYAALSYVWGGPRQLRLLQHSKAAFYERIPDVDLPGTVANAMSVVRDLGMRYIWVDALCIVQDDKVDWEVQAAAMDKIYLQASMTICVAYGGDSHAGIPGVEQTPGRRKQHTESYRDVTLTTMKPVASLVSASLWDSRAWTFQECLMSTRCAIFTSEGMIWQCPTATWREDIESPIRKNTWTLDSVASPLQALRGNPLRSYSSCVLAYSGRKLTFLKDKLVAFNGLGEVLGRGLGSRLQAGLPTRYFDWALLWEPEASGERIQVDVAFPSWAWCGWDHQVS